MKTYIIGGLCACTFIVSVAANLAIPDTHAKSENNSVREASSSLTELVFTVTTEKAVSLEVVSMKGCGPCARLKPVLQDMILEGYDIVIKDISKDTRGTTACPSLYFLDCDGNVILKQTGFRTAEQIKKYLNKCP